MYACTSCSLICSRSFTNAILRCSEAATVALDVEYSLLGDEEEEGLAEKKEKSERRKKKKKRKEKILSDHDPPLQSNSK